MSEGKLPRSVLVAEQDSVVQKLIKNHLYESRILDVTEVDDAQAAMHKILASPFDLLILDWKLKNPPSSVIVQEMQRHHHIEDAAVIFVAGAITIEDIKQIQPFKRASFIIKPFTHEVLLDTITRIFGIEPQETLSERAKKQKRQPPAPKPAKKESKSDIHVDRGIQAAGLDLHIDRGIAAAGLDLHLYKESRDKGRDIQVHKTEKPEPANFSLTQAFDSFQGLLSDEDEQQEPPPAPEGESQDAPTEVASEESGWSGRRSTKGYSIVTSDKQAKGEMSIDSQGPRAKSSSDIDRGGDQQAKGEMSIDSQGPRAKSSSDIDRGEGPQDKDLRKTSDGKPASFSLDHVPGEGAVDNPLVQISSDPLAPPPAPEAPVNINLRSRNLQIESALIIDEDDSHAAIVAKYLNEIGVEDIEICKDGKQAWDSLQLRNYDLTIMEWKLKEINGLKLYSRIRRNSPTSPIIVNSGLVSRQDFRILEESVHTGFLEKPYQISTLDKTISQLFGEIETDARTREAVMPMIDEAIALGEEMGPLVEYIAEKHPTAQRYIAAAGKYLFAMECYDEAAVCFEKAYEMDPRNIDTANWLAKAYHRLNRVEDSYRLLREANRVSPDNLERLCLMGELGLSLQDADRAQEHFEKALGIDDEDAVAKAGVVVADNMHSYLSNQENKPITSKFSSALNILGISLVRNEEFTKGIEQYNAAICFLKDNNSLSKLFFNVGLAHIRQEDFHEAKQWFQRAENIAPLDFDKPSKYYDICEKQLKKKKRAS